MAISDKKYKFNNLLNYTNFKLKDINKTYDDIDWIGSLGRVITVKDYKVLAEETSETIDEDLVIFFKDGTWLETDVVNDNYDFIYWYKHKELPTEPPYDAKKLTKLGD